MYRTPLVVVARPGEGRAAVDEVRDAGVGRGSRGTDQEASDIAAAGGGAVDVAGIGDREPGLIAGVDAGEDHALRSALAERLRR